MKKNIKKKHEKNMKKIHEKNKEKTWKKLKKALTYPSYLPLNVVNRPLFSRFYPLRSYSFCSIFRRNPLIPKVNLKENTFK